MPAKKKAKGKGGDGDDKAKRKEAKQQAVAAQTAKYKADQAALDKARDTADIFDTYKAFKRVQKAATGLDATLQYLKAEALSKELKAWMFDQIRANMKTFYEQCHGWGWKEKDKRKELDDRDGRYIVAFDTKSVAAAEADATKTLQPVPLAFVHVRFLLEDEERIVYVWELQVADAAKRKGLGKWLMTVVELVAWKLFDFERVALTVFKPNAAANKFYTEALKYEIDDADPSLLEPEHADKFGYRILCKRRGAGAVKPAAPLTAQQSVAQAIAQLSIAAGAAGAAAGAAAAASAPAAAAPTAAAAAAPAAAAPAAAAASPAAK